MWQGVADFLMFSVLIYASESGRQAGKMTAKEKNDE